MKSSFPQTTKSAKLIIENRGWINYTVHVQLTISRTNSNTILLVKNSDLKASSDHTPHRLLFLIFLSVYKAYVGIVRLSRIQLRIIPSKVVNY